MPLEPSAYLFAFALTLFAGLSTGIGAAIAFFAHGRSPLFLSFGLGFSAGVMLYVSFVEILAKATSELGAKLGALWGEGAAVALFFAGIGFAALIDYLIPEEVNPHELKSEGALDALKPSNQSTPLRHSALRRTGIFTAVAITIHNFPEGFATFVSALSDPTLGIMIALAIALHNIPEGMAVSLPIYHATLNKKTAFRYALLSGLAEPAGAVLGFLLLLPLMGPWTLGVTFALVAGIMVYISLDELLPGSHLYGTPHTAILGVSAGMAVMALSLWLFKF
ncbi:MAG: zinc transporter ZupT [Campylobacterales bacterium]|nr:zinc transporter ZupT [Campylobacterales bacterium]